MNRSGGIRRPNSPSPTPPRGQPPGTDWGNETARALGIVGKIMLKIFSYIINILLTVMLIGLITGLVVGSTFIYYVKNYIDADLSDFDMIKTSQSMTTKIYYMNWTDRENREGTPVEIEGQRLYGAKNSIWVAYKDIPDKLWQAFVAFEDKRFWEHHGVDFLRTASAAVNYFLKGQDSYGASTITQQLVKNVTQDDEVTVQRKITEIMRALRLEQEKDKTQILEMYLNLIYLSEGCYGVQAAANFYFDKDVRELNLVECAAIAAITQNPSQWDPILHPEANQKKRDTILGLMLEQGYITQNEYDGAHGKELILKLGGGDEESEQASASSGTQTYSWYTESVIDEAIDLFREKFGYSKEVASRALYTGGYKIYTAMDPNVQSVLENYFENDGNFISVDSSAIQPQASMVVMDPSSGDVVGIIGGRGIKKGNNILNYATKTLRSPGSSIKPLSVYGPALEYGLITWSSVFDDTPVNFGDAVYDSSTGATAGYSNTHGYPSNLPDTYKGLTAVADAIRRSVNTISLKVLQKLTLEKSFDFVKNKLHMDSFIESRELTGGKVITDKDYSALGLGGMNYGVTVLEMTAAYCIFDNQGIYNKPRIVLKILDSDNKVIIDNAPESSIVMSEQNASIMTKMLKNVVQSGTASAITVDSMVDVAGKTGTTTSDNDRWFMGYTPYYVAGVWFGYAMPKSLSKFSATQSPAIKIWDDVMTILHTKLIEKAKASGYGVESFKTAEGVVSATYCVDSGKLITDACKADPRGNRAEVGYFTQDTVPKQECDRHILVDFDKVSGGVACSGCPKENIKKYGLIKVPDRSFPYNIVVVDAEYVYRELPAGTDMSHTLTDPFFSTSLPAGVFVGRSSPGTQFNHGCTEHTEKAAETEPEYEDELPPGETKPGGDNGVGAGTADTESAEDNHNQVETEDGSVTADTEGAG